MLNLFLTELRRFGRFTLGATVAHLLAQFLAYRRGYFAFDMRAGDQSSFLALYAAVALLFAVVQLYPYRAANRWLWLLHRPLPRPAIFGALALAATAQITVVIGLPLLLTALGTDMLTGHVVDMRHYLSILFLIETCIVAWLVGATVVLGPSWTNILLLIVPIVLYTSYRVTAMSAVLAGGIAIALMAYIAYIYFKPDRQAPPVGSVARTIAAMPLLFGFYGVMMVALSILTDVGMRAIGKAAFNSTAPSGSWVAYRNLSEPKRMQALLATSTDPRREAWQRQLDVVPVSSIYQGMPPYAKRHDLSNRGTPHTFVAPNQWRWSFDHDVMRFVATHASTGERIGERGFYGAGDLTPFPTVPYDTLNYLITPQLVQSLDPYTMIFQRRIALAVPEQVKSEPKKYGDLYFMFTNQRLVAYQADGRNPDALWLELFSLPLPARDQTDAVDIARLNDVTLINLGRSNTNGSDTLHSARLVAVDGRGQATVVAENHLPVLFELPASAFNGGMTSPAMHALMLSIAALGAGSDPQLAMAQDMTRMPSPFWRIALALMMMSGALAWYRLRRAQPGTTMPWVATCLLLGPPALATLVVLGPRPHHLAKV